MPVYTYQCNRCRHHLDRRMSVGLRDTVMACPACDEGLAKRLFTPTLNIAVPEHFRHDQAGFLPPRSDTAAWEARSKGSQNHAARQETYEEFVRRDLREQGMA
jgi:putative FmdB family regulatory protein